MTASASGHPDAVATRTIDVSYDGVTVIVQVRGGGSWIYGLQDGIKSHNTGHAFVDGDSAVLRGRDTVEVDTSFSEYTFFTVNGQSLGSLGSGDQKWVFAKGQPPHQP